MYVKVIINVYINIFINFIKNICFFVDFCFYCLYLSLFIFVVCKLESMFEGLIKSSFYFLYFLRLIELEIKKIIFILLYILI